MILVVAADLRTPFVFLDTRDDGRGVAASIFKELALRRVLLRPKVTFSIVVSSCWEIPSELLASFLLAAEFLEARPLPVFPSSQWNM